MKNPFTYKGKFNKSDFCFVLINTLLIPLHLLQRPINYHPLESAVFFKLKKTPMLNGHLLNDDADRFEQKNMIKDDQVGPE